MEDARPRRTHPRRNEVARDVHHASSRCSTRKNGRAWRVHPKGFADGSLGVWESSGGIDEINVGLTLESCADLVHAPLHGRRTRQKIISQTGQGRRRGLGASQDEEITVGGDLRVGHRIRGVFVADDVVNKVPPSADDAPADSLLSVDGYVRFVFCSSFLHRRRCEKAHHPLGVGVRRQRSGKGSDLDAPKDGTDPVMVGAIFETVE